jgi:hypothetical protein
MSINIDTKRASSPEMALQGGKSQRTNAEDQFDALVSSHRKIVGSEINRKGF